MFDLDGTLADSQAGIMASYRAALEPLGLAATDEQLRAGIGPPILESLTRLGVSAVAQPQAVRDYRAHYSAVGLEMSHCYHGVVEMLQRLREMGIGASVATSKRQDFADRMVAHLKLTELIDVVSGASADGLVTTKAQIIAQALDELGGPTRHQTWMVGDRREDVVAAIELEMMALGALWGYGSQSELTHAGAVHLLERPRDLAFLVRDVISHRAEISGAVTKRRADSER